MKFSSYELFTLINVCENKIKYLVEKGLADGSEVSALRSILLKLKDGLNDN